MNVVPRVRGRVKRNTTVDTDIYIYIYGEGRER